ncbi:hypothetical protein OsJ_20332 [Oryza sativa Japonica Group]|uniref:Uncharacterized protein n=1 Tax=Oryza sativa subsp. japonica TaxID=39947 RepID=B9FRU2_ORYSJ|nr:hypothetical protein OsJ_20332 [Oryza sativa Japonica Group]
MAGSDHHPGGRDGAPLVFDELRWVIQIRRSLQEDGGDDDDDNGIPVSVFNVPKQLQAHKPEAYVPQFIALGPYHHWRPELYEMERYKLAAARRAQRHLREGVKLEHLVEQFARAERKVRAHYHRYLDFSGETLAWMMVVDGAFLLEFLQIFAAAEAAASGGGGKPELRRVSSRMAHLVDFAGRKSAHNLILRDMLMLENQIPLFLLRKLLEPQCSSAEEASELLGRMVTGLMKELCPFKMMDNFPAIDVAKHAHLLELLYHLLVPKPSDDAAAAADGHDEGLRHRGAAGGRRRRRRRGEAAIRRVRYVAKPISFAVKAPWKMLTVVPGFSAMKHPVESFFMSGGGGDPSSSSTAAGQDHHHAISRPPLIEEIMIPSVTELAAAGVQFAPTNGDATTVSFDAKTATLHLPVVTLDGSTTEVVLRNLVAYEASAATGPLVLARYTELMNGIIDTGEDVAALRRRGVVLNRMKSDGEAARLWNGMSRSVRLTKVAAMDAAVEGVNRYHGARWRVKARRFMRRYVFGSWQLLTFLAAVLMLLLTTLQAFCSVYTCSRWFGAVAVAPPP